MPLRPPKLGEGTRIFISGTPYLNYYTDLAAIFSFLRIRPFHNIGTFRSVFTWREKGQLDRDLPPAVHDFLKLMTHAVMLLALRPNQRQLDPAWVAEMQQNQTWRSSKVGLIVNCIVAETQNDLDLKVLVFDEFLGVLEVIGIGLTARDIPFVKITSEVSDEQKSKDIRAFRAPDGPPVLLTTPMSMSQGYTLTEASMVIIVGPLYTPLVEEQCERRVHRIGQDKKVRIIRFQPLDSVDERVINKFQKPKSEHFGRPFSDGLDLGTEYWSEITDMSWATGLGPILFPHMDDVDMGFDWMVT